MWKKIVFFGLFGFVAGVVWNNESAAKRWEKRNCEVSADRSVAVSATADRHLLLGWVSDNVSDASITASHLKSQGIGRHS